MRMYLTVSTLRRKHPYVVTAKNMEAGEHECVTSDKCCLAKKIMLPIYSAPMSILDLAFQGCTPLYIKYIIARPEAAIRKINMAKNT